MDTLPLCTYRNSVSRRVIAAFAVTVLAALLSVSNAAGADEPVVIDSFGVWNLAKLNRQSSTWSPGDGESIQVASYILPAGAQQGSGAWYLAHLRFAIEFNEQSGEGFAYVSVHTNDRAVIQVKFAATQREGALVVNWSTVDLLDGRQERETTDRRIEVANANYLQTAGVQAGVNTLTLRVEQHQGLKIDRLEVFDDSGIEYTPVGPAKLKLTVLLEEQRVRVGETFSIGYALHNEGDRLVEGVVEAVHSQQALATSDDAPQQVTVDAGSTQTGELLFTALLAGQHQVMLRVKSGSNRPGAVVGVRVENDADHLATRAVLVQWGAPLIVVGLLALVVRARLARKAQGMDGR